MSADRVRRRLLVVTAAALLLVGCGASARPSVTGAAAARSPGVPAAEVDVIVRWSTALRRGDIVAASRLFRLPGVFDNGSGQPVELLTVGQVESVNASLPCGATLVRAHRDGDYVNALFRLGNRRGPGGQLGCGSGAGQTARTKFLIRGGRIAAWVRAPDEPGDNAPSPTPTTPANTQPPAQV